MIVRICQSDLLKLVNDQEVVIGGEHIVRATNEESSMIEGLGGVAPGLTGRRASQDLSDEHSNARAAVTGNRKRPRRTGIHWIPARYSNQCDSPGCPERFNRGDQILYDYDNRRAYCEGHGNKIKPREEAST